VLGITKQRGILVRHVLFGFVQGGVALFFY